MKLAVAFGAIGIALLVGLNQDIDPYMDEIFHVPQAQRFCSHDFNYYDPKITTPPGLYILSLLLYRSIRLIPNSLVKCSTTFLRCTNGIISLGILPMLYLLRSELYPPPKRRRSGRITRGNSINGTDQEIEINRLHSLHSTVIFMYPISAFFYALYYTDSAALLMFLTTYYMSLLETHQEGETSASSSPVLSIISKITLLLSSSLAILARQTNAVWLMFIFGKFFCKYTSL